MIRVWLEAPLTPVCLGVPASAQSATDPIGTVRAFYTKDDVGAVRFYVRRLWALYQREAKGEIGRLDFAFHVNGQDTEDGWLKTPRLEPVSADEARAEVQATFLNGSAQELRYSLVREDGRRLIADVRSGKARSWDLGTILSRPRP